MPSLNEVRLEGRMVLFRSAVEKLNIMKMSFRRSILTQATTSGFSSESTRVREHLLPFVGIRITPSKILNRRLKN